MKTRRRLLGFGAGLAAAALVVTACGGGNGDDGGDAGGDEGTPTSMTVQWNDGFYSYNTGTTYGNHAANANIRYLTGSTFAYYDQDLNLVQDTDFGTFELVNENPTEVKYTVNEGVTWSDGTPIDAADLLLDWAGRSAMLNDSDVEPKYDDAGQIQPAEGNAVYFDGGSSSLAGTTATVGEDGRSITITWDKQYIDWEESFWIGANAGVPAHVVAKNALGVEDPTDAKQAVIDAVSNDSRADLAKLASDWNTGFNFEALPEDPDRYLSGGAYTIEDFEEGQFIRMAKRDDYWGAEPNLDELTVRYIDDPLAAVQALQNGEVDVIQPQSTADVLQALEGVQGVTTTTAGGGTYEHVDLNINNSKTEGIWDDANVRKAFLKTVPRQRIVEDLIKPLNPEAAVLNSQLMISDAPGYDQMVAENGSADYTEVDIDGATTLLADARVEDLTVCFLYDSANERRVNEFQLIKDSAAQAGITVEDCGSEDWGGLLSQPKKYDATLFGWQSEGVGVTESEANYVPGGANNFYDYENQNVVDLYKELSGTTDEERQLEISIDIEKELWGDGFGVTLFQFPEITGVSDRVSNVSSVPLSPTYFWNFWEWEVAS